MNFSPHRLWHSRGYLPHFDCPGMVQAITFRLADSLPQKVLADWRAELGRTTPESDAELRRRTARWEDAGHGECLLGRPVHAEVVENALLHFDGCRYRLLEWCIMPNHVHVILAQLEAVKLDHIVKSWKSFTARKINGMEGRCGALWERDYHDRYIRDGRHMEDARHYVRNNPVKAGLCKEAGDWRFGSAWAGRLEAQIQ